MITEKFETQVNSNSSKKQSTVTKSPSSRYHHLEEKKKIGEVQQNKQLKKLRSIKPSMPARANQSMKIEKSPSDFAESTSFQASSCNFEYTFHGNDVNRKNSSSDLTDKTAKSLKKTDSLKPVRVLTRIPSLKSKKSSLSSSNPAALKPAKNFKKLTSLKPKRASVKKIPRVVSQFPDSSSGNSKSRGKVHPHDHEIESEENGFESVLMNEDGGAEVKKKFKKLGSIKLSSLNSPKNLKAKTSRFQANPQILESGFRRSDVFLRNSSNLKPVPVSSGMKSQRNLTRKSSIKPSRALLKLSSLKPKRSLRSPARYVKLKSDQSPLKESIIQGSPRSSSKLKPSLDSSPEKLTRMLTRKTSLRPVRILPRIPSLRSKRTKVKKLVDLSMDRATCSSTLKDSKFPDYVEVVEPEGVSVMKVCPYTYCSLNGHHHHPSLPPLPQFISARRRSLKNTKSENVKNEIVSCDDQGVRETQIVGEIVGFVSAGKSVEEMEKQDDFRSLAEIAFGEISDPEISFEENFNQVQGFSIGKQDVAFLDWKETSFECCCIRKELGESFPAEENVLHEFSEKTLSRKISEACEDVYELNCENLEESSGDSTPDSYVQEIPLNKWKSRKLWGLMCQKVTPMNSSSCNVAENREASSPKIGINKVDVVEQLVQDSVGVDSSVKSGEEMGTRNDFRSLAEILFGENSFPKASLDQIQKFTKGKQSVSLLEHNEVSFECCSIRKENVLQECHEESVSGSSTDAPEDVSESSSKNLEGNSGDSPPDSAVQEIFSNTQKPRKLWQIICEQVAPMDSSSCQGVTENREASKVNAVELLVGVDSSMRSDKEMRNHDILSQVEVMFGENSYPETSFKESLNKVRNFATKKQSVSFLEHNEASFECCCIGKEKVSLECDEKRISGMSVDVCESNTENLEEDGGDSATDSAVQEILSNKRKSATLWRLIYQQMAPMDSTSYQDVDENREASDPKIGMNKVDAVKLLVQDALDRILANIPEKPCDEEQKSLWSTVRSKKLMLRKSSIFPEETQDRRSNVPFEEKNEKKSLWHTVKRNKSMLRKRSILTEIQDQSCDDQQVTHEVHPEEEKKSLWNSVKLKKSILRKRSNSATEFPDQFYCDQRIVLGVNPKPKEEKSHWSTVKLKRLMLRKKSTSLTEFPDQSYYDHQPMTSDRSLEEKREKKSLWNAVKMKKPMLWKRPTKELERVRKFNPRAPRFLPLEPEAEAEKVRLRHQEMEERKNLEEMMLDYVLQQAIAKLAPISKKRVSLLVEAFETVAPKSARISGSNPEVCEGIGESKSENVKASEGDSVQDILSDKQKSRKLWQLIYQQVAPITLDPHQDATENHERGGRKHRIQKIDAVKLLVQGALNRILANMSDKSCDDSITSTVSLDNQKSLWSTGKLPNGDQFISTNARVEGEMEKKSHSGAVKLKSDDRLISSDARVGDKREKKSHWDAVKLNKSCDDSIINTESPDDQKSLWSNVKLTSNDRFISSCTHVEAKMEKKSHWGTVKLKNDDGLISGDARVGGKGGKRTHWDAVKLNKSMLRKRSVLTEIQEKAYEGQRIHKEVRSESKKEKKSHWKTVKVKQSLLRTFEDRHDNHHSGEQREKKSLWHTVKMKKWMLQKKNVKESEKARKFNPRFLPLKPDPEVEKVNLRHQEMEERKKAEELMLDYALQQAVTKLAPASKRRVALLVEAFETVTPLPEIEPRRRYHTRVSGRAKQS